MARQIGGDRVELAKETGDRQAGWKSATQELQGDRAARWVFGSVAGASDQVSELVDVRVVDGWMEDAEQKRVGGQELREVPDQNRVLLACWTVLCQSAEGTVRKLWKWPSLVQSSPIQSSQAQLSFSSIAQASGQRVSGLVLGLIDVLEGGNRAGSDADAATEVMENRS